MGTFESNKVFYGTSALIPEIATKIQQEFQTDGYEVTAIPMNDGGYDISITKGGTFKAIIGMKTALKVTLRPLGNDLYFKAGIGIFGQYAVPTIIGFLLFWPVWVTQIWGMVEQTKLDDKALMIVEQFISCRDNQTCSETTENAEKNECPMCGAQVNASDRFCPKCGFQLKK